MGGGFWHSCGKTLPILKRRWLLGSVSFGVNQVSLVLFGCYVPLLLCPFNTTIGRGEYNKQWMRKKGGEDTHLP